MGWLTNKINSECTVVNKIMNYIMLQLGFKYEMNICENLYDSDIKS